MKIILKCPDEASAVPALSRMRPLVLAPFLGQTVLAHALSALATDGIKHVLISAAAGAEKILKDVGRGEAWGMRVEVCGGGKTLDGFPTNNFLTLDRLPQLPGKSLWKSYRSWQAAQLALLSRFAVLRGGMREIAPGVFAGLRTQISSASQLSGPCWIGDGVFIGGQTRVGPNTIIEDGSYIDAGAEVSDSIVGRQTYIGAFTELRSSFAAENQLLHLDSGSFTTISDRLLMSRVRPRPQILKSWRERFQPRRAAILRPEQSSWPKNFSGQKPPLKALLGNEAAT